MHLGEVSKRTTRLSFKHSPMCQELVGHTEAIEDVARTTSKPHACLEKRFFFLSRMCRLDGGDARDVSNHEAVPDEVSLSRSRHRRRRHDGRHARAHRRRRHARAARDHVAGSGQPTSS